MNECDREAMHRLVKKAIKGDKRAFEELYARNAKIILYQVGKLLDVKGDREDVAQEVVLHMYSGIGGLKSPQAFYSWMYRIITNACYKHNKNSKGKNDRDIDDYAEALTDRSSEGRPADLVEESDTNSIIRKLINELPEKQRLALFMHYYEQMRYDEIAEVLGVSSGTVGSNIVKAKRTLKKSIGKAHILAEDRTETLGGMAMHTALFAAFKADVDGAVTATQLDAFVHTCGQHIASTVASAPHIAAGHAAVKAGLVGTKLGIAATVGVSVTVGATVFTCYTIAKEIREPESPPAVVADVSAVYKPEANISLVGMEGFPSQINPSQAKLVIDNGTPTLWRIMDAEGEPVASGTGYEIGDALALTPGTYVIEWVVVNGEGQSAIVRREIEVIEESQVAPGGAADEIAEELQNTPENAVDEIAEVAQDTPENNTDTLIPNTAEAQD
jgi:RNA polymerase sigma-70 factor (ECF subfamily)